MLARRTFLSAMGVTGLAMSGCSVLTPTAEQSSSAAPVSTQVPDEEVEITVADWDNRGATESIIKAFEKKYPQVTVRHKYTEASDFQKTLKLVMQSENPPDVTAYNTPIRELGQAGLILDLSPYEKAYGWDKIVPASLLDQTRFSKDGKTMGEGALLAAPNTVPIVGVFANKRLTAKAGVKGRPATFEEFEANLATVKAAHVQPLEMGSLDFGGIHNWAAIVNAHAETAKLRNWLYGKPGTSIDDSSAIKATESFQRWASEGYYPTSANGTSDVDAAARFAEGKSAYLIDGSWTGGSLNEKLGDDVEFFLLPMQKADAALVASASVAAYSISAKSKNQTVAAAFLNFMYSPEAAKGITDVGNLSLSPEGNEGFSGVNKDIADAYAQIVESDGAMIFPDQSTPALLDVLTSQTQLVVAQKTTPEKLTKATQQAWADYHQ